MSARVPEHTLKNRSYRTLARVSALCAVSTVRNGRGRARCPGWCPCPPSGRRLGRSRVDGVQTRRVQACSGRLRVFRQRANETRAVAVRKRARPRRNRTQPPGRCPDGPCPDRTQTGRVQAQSGRRACLDGARTGPVQAPFRCARIRVASARDRPDGARTGGPVRAFRASVVRAAAVRGAKKVASGAPRFLVPLSFLVAMMTSAAY